MGAPKHSIFIGNLALLPAAILIAGVIVFACIHGSFAHAEPAAANPIPSPPPTPVPVPQPTPGNIASTNSLGMKFLPVDDVEFCIWVTRVKDYEAIANAVHLKSAAWKNPGFRQGPDHPVVNVSWNEAMAFCKWLTDKEHEDGVLPPNQFYRLPTDLEWSKAVGLPPEIGKTPERRGMGVPDVYPWGTQWPPPSNAGNYAGEETGILGTAALTLEGVILLFDPILVGNAKYLTGFANRVRAADPEAFDQSEWKNAIDEIEGLVLP